MDGESRELLIRLLEASGPSGFESESQRIWMEYMRDISDEISVDNYGNIIATHEGNAPHVAFTGHADEIGLIVRRIDDEGFIHPSAIGGADKTVARGQRVTIHTKNGRIPGVIGQTAIHLRDRDDEEIADVNELRIDIGSESGETTNSLVEVGDAITFEATATELQGTRLTSRAMDNRVGMWAAAEAFRTTVESDVSATVHAISTVQEEVGVQGAKMVGFDVELDAAIVIDVTHASDSPMAPKNRGSEIALGEGPVVSRGSANHPRIVEILREIADERNIPIQLQAAGSRTGTDADAFYTSHGGVPSVSIGIPNRYMHTPVEVIDTEDLESAAELLGEFAKRAADHFEFRVDF